MSNASTSAHTGAVHMERRMTAAPERVFRAWTNAADLKRWFGPPGYEVEVAEVDVRVGGAYRMVLRTPEGERTVITGEYRVVDSPKRLSFTWTMGTPEAPGVIAEGTLVNLEFRADGGGTRVVVAHTGFAAEEVRLDHEQGWGACLEALAGVVAGA